MTQAFRGHVYVCVRRAVGVAPSAARIFILNNS